MEAERLETVQRLDGLQATAARASDVEQYRTDVGALRLQLRGLQAAQDEVRHGQREAQLSDTTEAQLRQLRAQVAELRGEVAQVALQQRHHGAALEELGGVEGRFLQHVDTVRSEQQADHCRLLEECRRLETGLAQLEVGAALAGPGRGGEALGGRMHGLWRRSGIGRGGP